MMGVIYERRGDLDNAFREYSKALEYDYENPDLHIKLAIVYMKKSQLELAVEELKKASQYAPKDIRIHFVLALIYLDLTLNISEVLSKMLFKKVDVF